MNRVDWDSSSHTEWMTPCIGLRAAYRNSIANTATANTEKATLLGQNNHEFQVVITGSSICSYQCFSHAVTMHQADVRVRNLIYAWLGACRIVTCRWGAGSAPICAALGLKSSSLYAHEYTWCFSCSAASHPAVPYFALSHRQ